MENRDSFVFYRSFYESLKKLKVSDRVKIYDAICELALNQNENELDGVPYAIFALVKPQIVANNKKYLNGCKPKNKKNDTKQQLSEQQKKGKQDVSKQQANDKQNVSKTEGNVECLMKMYNVNENDNVNVNEKILINQDSINTKVRDLISNSFKRELTKEEQSQVISMCNFYGDRLVEYACRECVIYNQLNFGYLVKILQRWRADGMTPEKYELGET